MRPNIFLMKITDLRKETNANRVRIVARVIWENCARPERDVKIIRRYREQDFKGLVKRFDRNFLNGKLLNLVQKK